MTHIVDQMIEERAPWMTSNTRLVRLVRPFIYSFLQHQTSLRLHGEYENLPADEVMRRGARLLTPRIACSGLNHIPTDGPAMIVANHPSGIADGIVLDSLVRRRRDDIYIFANLDIIRLLPNFATLIAPVEWHEKHRSHAKTRDTITFVRQAVADRKIGIIFPSGRIARRRGFTTYERDWMTSAVLLARKNRLPIIPVHITAHNSFVYYFFDMLHETLRDIMLFRETLNKSDQTYKVRIGPPIASQTLSGNNTVDTKILFDAVQALGQKTTPLNLAENTD